MSSDLMRGRLQGLVIALVVLAIIGVVVLAIQWWINRTPDLGAPVYPRSTLERTIENPDNQITTHYLIAPADREAIFDYYEDRAHADCSEGMCYAALSPCGEYYAFVSGTTQGVTRYALEIRKEDCP